MMMYSQDGLGLGHMRRTGSIAERLLQVRPDTAVLTLADSPLGRFFDAAPNHDYLKLPSIVKLGPGDWKPTNLPLASGDVIAMRSELIWAAVKAFRPHILLVDHMPHGAMGELLPTLWRLQEGDYGTKTVLGLRDILDAPEIIRRRWQEEGAYEAIERFYDMVLVYGERQVFDVAKKYRLAIRAGASLRYCGYTCTPLTARYAARIRAENLGNGRGRDKQANSAGRPTKLIVAMAGGGADAYPMMRALLDAVPATLERQDALLMMITGPFMPANLRRHLQAQAQGLPVRVRMTVSDSLSYIDAADLVVSMAGYNTTMEILRSSKPAILIPRSGPSAEQRMRASLFAARGWVHMIDAEDLSPERVASDIAEVLAQEPGAQAERRPAITGLDTAVQHLLSLLQAGKAAPVDTTPDLADVNLMSAHIAAHESSMLLG
jgi:predicted glycosyltransferase